MANKKSKIAADIVNLYMSHRYPEEIREEVQRWLSERGHFEQKDAALRQIWNNAVIPETKQGKDVYRIYSRVMLRLGLETPERKRPLLRRKILLRIAAVIVPLLILGGVCGILFLNNDEKNIPQFAFNIDVDGGRQERIMLPDSSFVWVNSYSKLGYGSDFGSSRTVRVFGQTYFTVRKGGLDPFLVKTDRYTITVLGTRFDVDDHEDEGYSLVTLYSGGIRIDGPGRRQSFEMGPHTQARLEYASGKWEVSDIGQESIQPEWVSRFITELEYKDFGEILDAIGKYYGLSIDNRHPELNGKMFTVMLSGKETPEEVAEILRKLNKDIDFRIEQNRLIIE